jgi:acyl carrier protein
VSPITAERVRALILADVESSLVLFGHTADSVPDDFDLRMSGVVDSLGFLEVIGMLDAELGIEIDLELMEPDDLTVVGPLSRFVAEQAAARLVDAP